jgi:hypothetical protein
MAQTKKTLFLAEPHYEAGTDVFTAELQLTINDVTARMGLLHIDNHGVIFNVPPANAMLVIENMPVTNQLHLASLVTAALSDAFLSLDLSGGGTYYDAFINGDDVLVLEVIN